MIAWSPHRGWFWHDTDAGYLLHPRAGGAPISVKNVPGGFSPAEDRLASLAVDGELQLIDLETGMVTPLGIAPDSYEWVSDAGLLATRGSERWLVSRGGDTAPLVDGPGGTWSAAGDHLLYKAGDRPTLWNLATLEGSRLEAAVETHLSRDGSRLVWRRWSGELWVRDLERGIDWTIARSVDALLPLADVVIYSRTADPAAVLCAPYP